MNPLKEARLQQNMTQADLAQRANISVNAVIKYEQGLYEKPSTKIIEALGEDPYALAINYENWRKDHLRNNAWRFSNASLALLSGAKHPLTTFRIAIDCPSQAELAKWLCMHQATISKYESGTCRELPNQLRAALLEVLSQKVVENINALGIEYYNKRH